MKNMTYTLLQKGNDIFLLQAMQRNEFVGFCVDTKTGEKVPDTDYHTGVGNPITERICQAYSQLCKFL